VRISEAGLITVTGGKLTTYREMASDTVDTVMQAIGWRVRCRTQRLALLGADDFRRLPPSHPDAWLAGRYGSDMAEVRALIAIDRSLAEPLVRGLRYSRAEAVHAVRHEMATTLGDVLERRTRAHLRDRAACYAAAGDVAALLAGELGWSAAETERQVAEYREMCDAELAAATSATSAGSSA
jgi:glycerol-3-phosphate dehydrogenase